MCVRGVREVSEERELCVQSDRKEIYRSGCDFPDDRTRKCNSVRWCCLFCVFPPQHNGAEQKRQRVCVLRPGAHVSHLFYPLVSCVCFTVVSFSLLQNSQVAPQTATFLTGKPSCGGGGGGSEQNAAIGRT